MTKPLAFLFLTALLAGLAVGTAAQDGALQRERCGLDPQRRLPPGPDAIKACTAVLESGKETPRTQAQALVNRGNAWRMRERNIDRAIDDYTQAIRLQPDFATAFASRGFTWLFDRHDPDRAIADFNQALRLDPTTAYVFYYRAVAYSDKGELDRAIADFDQAIRLMPQFAIAWRDRGKARQAKGDQAGGAADIAEAERIGRQQPLCEGAVGCNRSP
jgi:tetratricopeptide (TPR) repeat protein